MPTNLPAEYYEVEKLYKSATTISERITYLEELLGTIPKHKGTDKLRAGLRRRLSKLKTSAESKKGISRRDSLFSVPKEGAGQVVVIGPTNVGKSSIVNALTNATPDIADYPFTTQHPIPGMMPIDNVHVQLIDTPPLSRDYIDPQLLGLIRRADMMLLVVDLQTFPIEQIEETLEILQENRIYPENLRDRITEESRRITFIPTIVLANKTDDDTHDGDFKALCELFGDNCPLLIPISTLAEKNYDRLKDLVYEMLEVMRVYSKPPGKSPDRSAPFVLKLGSTVDEFAAKVHRDFVDNLKSARVWGSATHDGQMVGRDHILHDGDVVELKTK